MKKPILAALLGGLVVFVWGTISHLVLPLGQAGVSVIRPESEPVVLATMKASMPERALYIFPGMKPSGATDEDRRLWQERHKAGPAGIVAMNPKPTGNFGTWLGMEYAGNALAALMASLVMLRVPVELGLLRRAGLVSLFGLFETFDIDLSQWNWYGFPTPYLTAQAIDHTIGWFLGGLAIAWICGREEEEVTPRRVPARPPVPARRPPAIPPRPGPR